MKRILLLVLVVAFCIPLFAVQAPPKKAENKQITATESTDNLNKKSNAQKTSTRRNKSKDVLASNSKLNRNNRKSVKTTSIKSEKNSISRGNEVGDRIKSRNKASHWSIMGAVGVGLLDGDNSNRSNSYKFNGLINVEYTINPAWGIYAEFLYNPYEGSSLYVNQNNADPTKQIIPGKDGLYNYKGVNREITLGVSVNALNLFYNCRHQKFQWYVNAGAGISLFDMTSHSLFPNNSFQNDQLNVVPTKSKTLTIPVGTTLEWNASSWLSVLANVQYRFHSADNYDASVIGRRNDGTVFAGLGLRWKINSSKDRSPKHYRDMAMCQFEPSVGEELVKQSTKKALETEPVIKELEQQVENLELQVKALENEIRKTRSTDTDASVSFAKNQSEKEPEKNVEDEGSSKKTSNNNQNEGWEITWNIPGVKNNNVTFDDEAKGSNTTSAKSTSKTSKTKTGNRTNNANRNSSSKTASKNTTTAKSADGKLTFEMELVGDETVEGNNNATAKKGADSKAGNRAANTAAANSNNAKAATTATTAKKNKGSVIQIFYNTSKHNTQDVDESEVALAEVARRLSSNPKLLIQIKAYADEQGDDKGFDNQKLTDVRAQETKDILVNKYGVDEKRIVLCKGFGSVKGAPSIDYQPNRRTDICFVQKIVQKPK
ncbi:MAG: OmpA family protein [Bacteroidota bacterium]|jgi:ompA family protein